MSKCSGAGTRRTLWGWTLRGFCQCVVVTIALNFYSGAQSRDYGQETGCVISLIRICENREIGSVALAATRWHTAVSRSEERRVGKERRSRW